jgi:hypothetical protein
MSNPENKEGFPVNPDAPVTSTQNKTEALNTHGGTQKSEANYKAIIEKSINESPSNTRRK